MPRFIFFAVFLMSTLTYAAPTPGSALLPSSFAGWTRTSAASAAANPADAAVLQEYGLSQLVTAQYASGRNRLSVQAWRFADATGAYGAFTFFRQPQMRTEPIGKGAAVEGNHFLFWAGATVVDASFAHSFGGEQEAIAALVKQIPAVGGSAGVPPSLPDYLPHAGLDISTIRYAIGPAAYARLGGAVPVSAIDFSVDAEAVTAQYGPGGAQETLTLVLYPTPQIAAARLKTLDALTQSDNVTAKRSGPLVAAVTGHFAPSAARQLLGQVRFSDYVTINHPEGYVSEGAKLYGLLRGITVMVCILVTAALLLGFFLGGGRALIRVLRGKPVSSVSEEEFISLHLEG